MSFPSFLHELGQLIQHRGVVSCIHPRLIALDTVNELATLTCAHPGLVTNRGSAVRAHLEEHPAPALLFVSEHLADGAGVDLLHDLQSDSRDLRSILVLTDEHDIPEAALKDPAISALVIDRNIGGPTCVLTQALQAVNRDDRFIDPAIQQSRRTESLNPDQLSQRELDVLTLVAEGLSNKEVGERLHLASTTVRDHMQSVMRKLNASSRTGAAVAGLRQGLLAS